MEELKQFYAWQDAIKLSKRLVQLCESFSDPNNNVVVWHLRQAVIDIPAGIAADLQLERPATMDAVVRLAIELELVRMIYPGIETSAADEQLEKLTARMQSEAFAARKTEKGRIKLFGSGGMMVTPHVGEASEVMADHAAADHEEG